MPIIKNEGKSEIELPTGHRIQPGTSLKVETEVLEASDNIGYLKGMEKSGSITIRLLQDDGGRRRDSWIGSEGTSSFEERPSGRDRTRRSRRRRSPSEE